MNFGIILSSFRKGFRLGNLLFSCFCWNFKKKLIKYTFSLNYFKRSNTKQPRSVPIVINVIIIIRTDELIYIYIFVPYMKFLEILEWSVDNNFILVRPEHRQHEHLWRGIKKSKSAQTVNFYPFIHFIVFLKLMSGLSSPWVSVRPCEHLQWCGRWKQSDVRQPSFGTSCLSSKDE